MIKFTTILTEAIRLHDFPAFCAILVGGSTILPVLVQRLYVRIATTVFRLPAGISPKFIRFTRFASSLLSSWFCFRLLNQRHDRLQRGTSISNNGDEQKKSDRKEPEFAGQTLDITLVSVIRAVDALGCIMWARWSACRKASKRRTTCLERIAPNVSDTVTFVISSTVIMWAWFYHPGRLPRTYEKWISDTAQLDMRLVELLRRARRGEFVYGKDTGQAPYVQKMCRDYGLPPEWGDPAKTIPLPCEVVHLGAGPSCEKYAAYRFLSTLKFAGATYLPLQVLLRLRKLRTGRRDVVVRTATDAARSSAFLASFVSIFYYSVCLARTRLGPKLFDSKTVTPQMWDSGLCVGAGCVMCGFSILLEQSYKKKELALFVAPRAAAAVLPRVYDRKVCI